MAHWSSKGPCKERSEMSGRDRLTDERRLFEELCTTIWLEEGFRRVNREKRQVARSDRAKFLGMTIVGATIAISHKALQSAMAKVKELTPRGTHLTLETSIERINSWYVGWSDRKSVV